MKYLIFLGEGGGRGVGNLELCTYDEIFDSPLASLEKGELEFFHFLLLKEIAKES